MIRIALPARSRRQCHAALVRRESIETMQKQLIRPLLIIGFCLQSAFGGTYVEE